MEFSFFKSTEVFSGFILITEDCYRNIFDTVDEIRGKKFSKAFNLALLDEQIEDVFIIGTETSLPLIAANYYNFNNTIVNPEKNLYKIKVKIPKFTYCIGTDNNEIILASSIIIDTIDTEPYISTAYGFTEAIDILNNIKNSKYINLIKNSLGYYNNIENWFADLFLYAIIRYRFSVKDYIVLMDKFGTEKFIPFQFRQKVIWSICIYKNHAMSKALHKNTCITIFNDWGLEAVMFSRFDNFSKWYLNNYFKDDVDDVAIKIMVEVGGLIKAMKALFYIALYHKKRGDTQ